MVASPHLLKTMGLQFSREILYNDPNPEQKMWRAVIINAFDETFIYRTDRRSSLIKMNAHNWILSKSDDFQTVCNWANVDSELISTSYKTACETNKIKFKHKQISWKKYDKSYKLMQKEKNPKIKYRWKKEILRIRRSIITSSDCFVTTLVNYVIA